MGSTTKHTHVVVFGKREPTCPRCAELDKGAPVRRGWGQAKREAEERQLQAIRTHDCTKAGCGPVCTHGDW